MPIDGMPILEVIVRQLAHFRIKEMVFTVSQQSEPLLSAYFGNGGRYGVNIRYSREEKPLGTAGPLSLLSGPSGNFFGDERRHSDHTRLRSAHPIPSRKEGSRYDCHEPEEGVIGVGRDGVRPDSRLTRYLEKPVL